MTDFLDQQKERVTLRTEIFAIINCCGINYYGTYFCDFGPKPQKNWSAKYSLDESIAKINSAFSSKNFYL